ncbi:EthD domain-containing protein [Ramlibacter albus]|uniref:EthD domain-containing protein n=1 Tax=Ramlibacter albus TaxID=2079448 RepID=A0A923MCL9_9BURK|nr:EthD domain-containing protein [Ramlibacter albus]MBC5767081.1 EthD domain-containing protein [Ramlibacter albus]
MAHLMFCLRRLPHLTREQFQDYWRNVHGPLVRSHAEAMGLSAYVQSHSLPEATQTRLAQVRGSPLAFDGIAQLWWHDRVLTPEQKDAARRANAELLEDERKFIDLAASPIFLVEDHEILRLFTETRA